MPLPDIDYLSSRVMVEKWSSKQDHGENDTNPLVDQAVQLADYIPKPETEFNLRKSAAVSYYHINDPDTAKEPLNDARDLAEETDDHVLVEDTEHLLQRIEEQQDPYDRSDNNEDGDEGDDTVPDPEEVTRKILELQGINVDLDSDLDTSEYAAGVSRVAW